MGGGTHGLAITKEIRKRIGKDIGDTVDVTVTQDLEPREVAVPADLQVELDSDTKAAERFAGLSYTRRKEMARALETAVREDTRSRRLARILEELGGDH